jgi:hypothetical protein
MQQRMITENATYSVFITSRFLKVYKNDKVDEIMLRETEGIPYAVVGHRGYTATIYDSSRKVVEEFVPVNIVQSRLKKLLV